MKHFNLFIFFFLLIIWGFVGCKEKPKVYTKSEALSIMKGKAPVEAAQFYIFNKEKNPYLDSLYIYTFVPELVNHPMSVVKQVYQVVKKSRSAKYVECLYDELKDLYLVEVYDEIDSLKNEHIRIFQEDVLPMVDLAIDSLVNEDLVNVVEDFSGGVLNIKKIGFFFGRGNEKFKEKWEKHIEPEKYQKLLNDMVSDFMNNLISFEKDYYKSATNNDVNIFFQVPSATLKLNYTNNVGKAVEVYTANETKEMTWGLLKDWVAPAAISAFSGGIATLYEIGNFVNDMKVTYDDVKALKTTSEDILIFNCASEIEDQIINNFIQKVDIEMTKQIIGTYQFLYERIEANYTL